MYIYIFNKNVKSIFTSFHGTFTKIGIFDHKQSFDPFSKGWNCIVYNMSPSCLACIISHYMHVLNVLVKKKKELFAIF